MDIDKAWKAYLEHYRNDGRQIHKPTGTPGYDEQEWLAFEWAWQAREELAARQYEGGIVYNYKG